MATASGRTSGGAAGGGGRLRDRRRAWRIRAPRLMDCRSPFEGDELDDGMEPGHADAPSAAQAAAVEAAAPGDDWHLERVRSWRTDAWMKALCPAHENGQAPIDVTPPDGKRGPRRTS